MNLPNWQRNILTIVGLYGITLIAAFGCPASRQPTTSDKSSDPVQPISVNDDSKSSQNASQQIAADSSEQSSASQNADKEKFDPIKVNGKYFEGWPKPKLAIVISGRQDGYLEPCGCAGLDKQIGGISRRHAFIEQLKERGWPVMAVDVGDLVRRFGKQAEIQFAISAEALKTMDYSAVGFGTHDLRLSAGEVAAAIAGAEPGKSLFVSANVDILGLVPKVQIVEAGGMKIGVTAVLGESFQKQVNNAEIVLTPPAAALAEIAPQLKACNVRILLANATLEESKALAKQFPEFDYVVTADGGDVPPNEAATIDGTKTKIIEVAHKGGYCIVLGLYDNSKEPMRYQRVALDSRFPSSPEMKQIMAAYQGQLHDLGWDGLGLRPVGHPRAKQGVDGSGQFVGAETCKGCHTKAWDVWAKTGHAHATETLVKADPPRQFDPECISCHAVGWNANEFFPYASGFQSLETTPHLVGNSCENCHGPGGAHVAAEEGDDTPFRTEQRELMKLSLKDAKDHFCLKCHDVDNSPEFALKLDSGAFEKYWKAIEHKGKD